MVDISSCFQFLKNDLLLPETEVGKQHMLMPERADLCVKEPSKADIDKQRASAGDVPGDVAPSASNATATDHSISKKRTSRKCSMRICKQQGTFQCPHMSAGMAARETCSPPALPEPLTAGDDLVATNFNSVNYNLAPSSLEKYMARDGLPTLTSTSSITNPSTRLPFLPTPSSLLQPPTMAVAQHETQAVQTCSTRGSRTRASHLHRQCRTFWKP